MDKLILFDNPVNGWSHLVANDIDTLHEFAEKLGLKRCWYQNKKKKNKRQPHYDIRPSLFEKAISLGAKRVTRKELLIFLKTHYPII